MGKNLSSNRSCFGYEKGISVLWGSVSAILRPSPETASKRYDFTRQTFTVSLSGGNGKNGVV